MTRGGRLMHEASLNARPLVTCWPRHRNTPPDHPRGSDTLVFERSIIQRAGKCLPIEAHPGPEHYMYVVRALDTLKQLNTSNFIPSPHPPQYSNAKNFLCACGAPGPQLASISNVACKPLASIFKIALEISSKFACKFLLGSF